MNWIPIAKVEDCPPGSSLELVAETTMVALYNVDGEFHALDGVCPHQGGPLGKGQLHGCIVTCPWHGWQFDVQTGQHQASKSIRHPTLPLKVTDGQIFVAIEQDGDAT